MNNKKERIILWRNDLGHVIAVLDDWSEYYYDTMEPYDKSRPCTRCGKLPTHEGHDSCLGHLPGVTAACCGHGVEEGYILFDNGMAIRGNLKLDISRHEAREKIIKYFDETNEDISPVEVSEDLDLHIELVTDIFDELEDEDLLRLEDHLEQ